eukprot:scaffold6343_cov99-Cylindrotheca_fusiformis.AAC.1
MHGTSMESNPFSCNSIRLLKLFAVAVYLQEHNMAAERACCRAGDGMMFLQQSSVFISCLLGEREKGPLLSDTIVYNYWVAMEATC